MSRLSQSSQRNNIGISNSPNIMPHYNLAGVLHFLQSEWRNFEKERNEWEIERAELNAKVASLEGERRASDSVINDLLRRIKMLEYALRQERGKFMSSSVNSEGVPSPTPSSSSAPTPVNYAKHILKSRNSSASIGGQKSKYRKDKCREVLKLCLEELNTIPSTIPQENVNNNISGYSENLIENNNYNELDALSFNKMGDKNSYLMQKNLVNNNKGKSNLSIEINTEAPPEFISSPLPPEILKKPTATTTITVVDDKTKKREEENKDKPIPRKQIINNDEETEEEKRKRRITVIVPDNYQGEIFDDMGHNSPLNNSNISDPDLDPVPLNPILTTGEDMIKGKAQDNSMASLSTSAAGKLSSILKALGRKQEEDISSNEVGFNNAAATLSYLKGVKEGPDQNFLNQEPSLTIENDQQLLTNQYSSTKNLKDQSMNYSWKPKLTLKSHLDTVRSIDFHSKELILASGSDDGTVKLWNLQSLATLTKKTARQEIEPIFVYRGHSGPITSIVINSEDKSIYSSGFDSTIKAWKFPREGRTIQDPTEPSLETTTFIGHTDIVWNIKLRPNSINKDKILLASASADKTVKLWDASSKANNLLLSSFTYDSEANNKIIPTAVDFCHSDLNKMLISFNNSIIHMIDIETGKLITKFNSDVTYDGTSNTQINSILSHPTMPIVISAHEDKYIRFFDINSGKSIHSMIAHLGSVSSLDVSSSNLTLVSGGHDASIRWWDLSNYSCIQEFSSHRSKTSEAVYSVKFHNEYPWLATAGADSIIKLFTV